MLKKGNYENIPIPNPDYYEDCTLVEGDYSRLARLIEKAEAGEDLVIVGIGGSITYGAACSPDKTYGHLVKKWFTERYPDIRVFYINRGIGATGSIWGAERVERDVLSSNPDLVFVEFSVNDADTLFEKEAYESMLRKILDCESKPAVMHIANVRFDIATGEGKNVQDMHAEICEHYGVPAISMKDGVYGKLEWTEFIPDTIHPNDFGHEIIASLIMMKLSNVAASLDTIDEPDYTLPAPVTNDGFKDCIFIKASSLEVTDVGSWDCGLEIVGREAGGKGLVFETDYSYLMLRYLGIPEGNSEIKIVVDGDEENARIVNNYCGLPMHLVADGMYLPEPGNHRVEITMTKGSEFTIVGIFAANFKNKQ